MSYQVIARRWRPKNFSEVVGQDHVTRTLQNALKQGRLAHAFLFTGPRGVGKTSTARILARAINCTNFNSKGDGEPCNECVACKALLEERELDVIEMDAASNRSVDDIRKINDAARLVPASGFRKIFIVDEVHMLTREAFNAFLKTLEEPPEHVIFILATTDVQKVPSTIRSRVQKFDFRPLNAEEISAHLKHICDAEKWPSEPEALWIIARHADGSLRDAEGMLDRIVSYSGGRAALAETREAIGDPPEELFLRATRIIAAHDSREVPVFFQDLMKIGVDYTFLLQELQKFWMDIIFLKQKLSVPGRSESGIQNMLEASSGLEIEDLFRLIRFASQLEDEIKWSLAPRIRFEVSFLRWSALDRAVDIQSIISGLPPQNPQPSTARASAPAAPPKSAAPAPKISQDPAPKPAPVNGKSVHGESTTAVLSLPSLMSKWNEVIHTLEKSKPAAAAISDSWELVSLEGSRLTIRPKMSGDFHYKQLKDYLPNIAAAIQTATGHSLILSAAEGIASETPAPASKEKKNPRAADSDTAATSGQDLFSRVKTQFGGEEIPGKSS